MGLFSKKHKKSYYDYSYINAENADYPMLDDEGIIPIGKRTDINFAPHALTADEVKGNEPVAPVQEIPMQSAGESLYKRMMDARKEENAELAKKAEEVRGQTESLLSRCSQFTEGQKPAEDSEPLYKLDSIEDIIAEAEKRAEQRVNSIYNKSAESKESETAPVIEKTREAISHSYDLPPKDETVIEAVEGLRLPEEKTEETSAEDVVSLEDAQEENIEKTQVINLQEEPETITMVHETEVKNYQYRFADEEIEEPETADESTMPFTALSDDNISPYVEDIKSSTEDSFDDQDECDEFEDDDVDAVFDDYETVEDAPRIRKNLKLKNTTLGLRITFTAIIAVCMLLSFLPFMAEFKAQYDDVFAIANLALTVTAAIINFDIFKSFASLFGKRTDMDLSLALCTIVSAAYGVYSIATANYSLASFGAIPVLGMLFSAIGKKQNVTRILKNFECISNSDEKYALHLIDENSGSFTIAYDAIDGEALVAAGKKTVNILGFLKNSYSRNPFERKGFVLSAIGTIVCAIMAVYCFVTLETSEAFGYTALMFCVASPFSVMLVSSLPLKLASRRLSEYGAMLSGYKAAEKIEPVNAIVLDAGSIFPRGTVKMFDMKILAANDLERTIFNAAAVTTSIGSPLGHVFRRIARTSDDYVLPTADSVKYEKRMGVSGWVGDESLLIGNRTLMETHGVAVPSAAVDKKILRSGYFPVYVASDGNPCALLIVGYENDRQITKELHRLCDMGVTLLINNCDPNITEEMICDYFDLPNDFVKVMKSGSVKKYEECTEAEENIDSGAAFSGGAPAIASIVTAAIKVKRLTSYMTVLHTLTYILGLVGAALLIILGNLTYLTPLFTLAYLALSLIVVYLAPLFYKP